jgi:hypothetical protein
VQVQPIGWREFGQFVGGKKNAGVVEALLGEGTWLRFTKPYERGVHSRVFTLAPSMWPPRPGEPRMFTPWSPLPGRLVSKGFVARNLETEACKSERYAESA